MEYIKFNDIVTFPRYTLHNGAKLDQDEEFEETADSQDVLVTGNNQKDQECENNYENDIHITEDESSLSDW